ncbi:hypothetical protein [Bradyrhizobium sp. Ai1a-2]|uniref:hypothetical protein n=1 Tax=Bradyrhizobium sp. Ai1a-2 TaxID=196490 RepID=UPI000409033D|nr:hypothetical protein [Bradyrhizobium sp. Ai1a-2]
MLIADAVPDGIAGFANSGSLGEEQINQPQIVYRPLTDVCEFSPRFDAGVDIVDNLQQRQNGLVQVLIYFARVRDPQTVQLPAPN